MFRFPAARTVWMLVFLAVTFAVIPGAAQQGPAAPPRRGGVLRVAHVGEPPTLDMQWTSAAITSHIMYNVYEGLFALDGKWQPKPLLLESWNLSRDRLTYTFDLRRGVRFHNGKEMTSEDVKASIERWGRLSARARVLMQNVASLTAPTPAQVVLKLREPYSLLPMDLGLPGQSALIYPKEVIDEAGAGQVRRFIGTGPYRFVEHIPDRHVRLERFDGYQPRAETPDGAAGRKHAYFDSIQVIPVPDAAVRVAGVRRGDYHFAEAIPADDYERLRADPQVAPYVAESAQSLAIIFNNRQGLFQNPKIRQAFQAALDHESLMRAAFGDRRLWRIDAGLVPKEHYLWTDAGKEKVDQRNPSRARQLLQEGGYRNEPVRWLTTMEYASYGTAAQVAKPMLERAGFTVDLQVVDWATIVSRRVRPELWDVYSTALAFPPDPVFVISLQPTFPGWYDTPDMKAMMTLLRRHAEPSTRRRIWERMQRRWYDDAGSVKIGDFFALHLHRRDLRGYANTPIHIWWNAWLAPGR